MREFICIRCSKWLNQGVHRTWKMECAFSSQGEVQSKSQGKWKFYQNSGKTQGISFSENSKFSRLFYNKNGNNWPLSKSAPLVADPCRSVYIAQKRVSDGVENTPSAAILWAIYNDLHGFATRGALLESGQLTV